MAKPWLFIELEKQLNSEYCFCKCVSSAIQGAGFQIHCEIPNVMNREFP